MIKKSGMLIKKIMKGKSLKGKLIYLPLICMILLHMPIVFAATKIHVQSALVNTAVEKNTTDVSAARNVIEAEYDSMHLDVMGLSKTAFNYAMKGFNYLVEHGRLSKDNIISIADFSQPSSRKRLFVIDLNNLRVLYNTYVAHGVNSGKEYANQFSNIPESNQSSLGFYETKNTYQGGNGYSLRLEGLERGINDNAEKRDIVIHGAGYVDESLIRSQGYIGRSWGCPALPEKLHKPIIDKIKNGSCLFIYSANNAYLKKSRIINA
jgi:L,D-transpeptidase catalytic domain